MFKIEDGDNDEVVETNKVYSEVYEDYQTTVCSTVYMLTDDALFQIKDLINSILDERDKVK